jgi:hypothetical protein
MAGTSRRDGSAPPHAANASKPEAVPAPSAAAAPGVSASPTAAAPPAKTDVVLLGPPTADGDGIHVLRARDERLEAGELRALREGKPITGEVVSLEPRADNPHVCNVTASYSAPAPRGKGPPQIASEAYRSGWDEIFGPRPTAADKDQLN